LVGVSVQQVTYGNSLDIAAKAKAVGAEVVFGGHHATQLAREMMENQHYLVDAVVSNDGEIPLRLIAQGFDFRDIPNLTFWDDGVIQNAVTEFALDQFLPPDYSGLDLIPYAERYSKRLGWSEPRIFLRTNSHKGCGNRFNSNACYFCGRADKSVRFKSPAKFVQELTKLKQRWGASEVFDVGDDIAFRDEWLRETAERIEAEGLELPLGCFGRAARLRNAGTARLLLRMGVSSVIIGFESGDPTLLSRCGKGTITPQDNLVAARNLFDLGIDTVASYVIGLPGENESSLRRTYDNAANLVAVAKRHLGRAPYELVANLFEPSPGSPAFCRMKQVFPMKYLGQDRLDLATCQADYFRAHWGFVTDEEVEGFRQLLVRWGTRINALITEADCQGFRVDEVKVRVFAPTMPRSAEQPVLTS
jgi:radical SAM superfamily enzyme YgiQ (UPF0313 family)